MRTRLALAVPLVAGSLVVSGCGGEQPTAADGSGVVGLVHLGPQCPVEVADDPCPDRPAAQVVVTVSKQLAGEAYAAGAVVARGTTDDGGRFRITVPPGEYVVTADAGMSCELMDARVPPGSFAQVDIPCDTGVR